jgi:hypothetical protein
LQVRRELPRRSKIEAPCLLVEEPNPSGAQAEEPRDDLERPLERERRIIGIA